jgi:hypothetical protein
MNFCHGAGDDLKRMMTALGRGEEQIAFARFGDGEEKMCMGGTYHCSDGWVSRPGAGRYRPKLLEAMQFVHENYYVGMRLPRNLKLWAWYRANMHTPSERVCDPCLFVNSRWKKAHKFFKGFRKKAFLVGSGKGVDYRIPANCIQPEYNYEPLLKKLLALNKPILLAAGPLANILVMEYIRAGGRQSIIDLGTVLDLEMFGKPTRRYLRIATKRGRSRMKARPRKKRKVRRRPQRPKPSRRPPGQRGTRPRSAILVEKYRIKKARKLAARRKK